MKTCKFVLKMSLKVSRHTCHLQKNKIKITNLHKKIDKSNKESFIFNRVLGKKMEKQHENSVLENLAENGMNIGPKDAIYKAHLKIYISLLMRMHALNTQM